MGLELGAVGRLGVLLGQLDSWGLEESSGGSTKARREGGESGGIERQSEPIAVQNLLAVALQSGFAKYRPGCMYAQFAAHFPKRGIWYTGPRSLMIMCNSLTRQAS